MAEMKYVYTIIERENLEKKHWVKVGVAFVNRDNSLNIHLDALPVNGMLQVRERRKESPKDGSETAESV